MLKQEKSSGGYLSWRSGKSIRASTSSNIRAQRLNITNIDQLILRNNKWIQFLDANGELGSNSF